MSTNRIRLYPDNASLPDDWYDPREDECPDCGRDIPSGWCQCRWDNYTGQMIVGGYDNGDRADDVDSGIANDSESAFYISDGA